MLKKSTITALILSFSTPLFASAGPIAEDANAINNNTSAVTANTNTMSNGANQLATYLKNLGAYLGYDIAEYCDATGNCATGSSPSSSLFNSNNAQVVQLNALNSYIGALFGGGSNNTGANQNLLVPTSTNGYSVLNSLGEQTLSYANFSSPSSSSVAVSKLIDQPAYQQDPVSQAVLNILATPSFTYCLNNNATAPIPGCQTLYREKVISNVVGELPGTEAVFSGTYNQPLIAQLNSNTLLAPLMYSTEASNASTSQVGGLPATNQAQQAENFIRYVSDAMNPITQPTRQSYDKLFAAANNFAETNKGQVTAQQIQAQQVLTLYLTRLRSYAAQSSVVMSNFYYILSRRMPQTIPGSQATSSEALNEYTMATWRLYNPKANGDTKSQWLNKIDTASQATVLKEIAVLLSEIQLQLYWTRQMQERMLFTETTRLMTSMQTLKPSGDDVNDQAKNLYQSAGTTQP